MHGKFFNVHSYSFMGGFGQCISGKFSRAGPSIIVFKSSLLQPLESKSATLFFPDGTYFQSLEGTRFGISITLYFYKCFIIYSGCLNQ